MPSLAFLVPGHLHALTGGSIYDRRMVEGLRARDWTVHVHELQAPGEAADVFASLGDGTTAIVDGMIFGRIPDAIARHAARLRLIPIVHLPLAEEPGLGAEAAAALEAFERRALQSADRVVVTGRATVKTVTGYGVPLERVAVVEPGTDPAPIAAGSGSSTLQFLCVATMNPGKGHEILVRALVEAGRSRAWQLTCVGAVTRHPETVEHLRAVIAAEGVADRVMLTGGLEGETLAERYHRADAFVLATRRETYGMAVAEAIACGLPVISTRTGAIPSLVGEGGLLVAPGDDAALASALSLFMDDEMLRSRLQAGAVRARAGLRTWPAAVDDMVMVLRDGLSTDD